MREIINGIFDAMRSGCPWRLLPSDLPPWGAIYRWFAKFRDEGRFEKINRALVMLDRERIGRHTSPTGAIIDRWGLAAPGHPWRHELIRPVPWQVVFRWPRGGLRMTHHVGLDLSVRETSICTIDAAGTIVKESWSIR